MSDRDNGSYWINGIWYEVPAGGQVEFLVGGGRPYCSQMKLYYVMESGGGTFKIQTNLDGAGYSDDSTYSNVDTNNATTTAGIATINATLAGNSLRVVGLTGTVRIILATYVNESGAGVVNLSQNLGGLPLSTHMQTPEAIRDVVLGDMGVDLFFMEFKDQSDYLTSFPTWIVTGKPPKF